MIDFQAGMAALKLSAVSFPLAVAPAPQKGGGWFRHSPGL